MDEDTKVCTRCRAAKARAEFNKDRSSRGGLGAYCLSCHAERARARYAKNPERVRESINRWRTANPERARESVNHWRTANPDRVRELRRWNESNKDRLAIIMRAKATVHRAIRSGKLVRPPVCEQCGLTSERIEASHTDYNQPLLVRWLCVPCHRAFDARDPKTLRAGV